MFHLSYINHKFCLLLSQHKQHGSFAKKKEFFKKKDFVKTVVFFDDTETFPF